MDLFEKLENYSTSKNKKNMKSKKSSKRGSKRSSKNGKRSSSKNGKRSSSKNGRRSSSKRGRRSSRNNSNKPVILDLNNRRSSQDPRKFMFPKDKNVDFRDLMISNVSEYSVDRPEDAEYICKIMKSHLPKRKSLVVTDATSNVGGGTIAFAKNFSKVNAVELEEVHCKALHNNLKKYKLDKKVKIYCDSYLDMMDELKQDIIYFDPPWGGRDYKKKYFMDLFLGDMNMIDVIRQVKNKTKLIVFKVPKNYNFFNFFLRSNFDKITIYKIYKFFQNKKRVSYYIMVLEV